MVERGPMLIMGVFDKFDRTSFTFVFLLNDFPSVLFDWCVSLNVMHDESQLVALCLRHDMFNDISCGYSWSNLLGPSSLFGNFRHGQNCWNPSAKERKTHKGHFTKQLNNNN